MQFSDSAFAEFIAEGEEILQRVSLLLTKSDTQELSKEDISSLYRDIHTLKGSSQLFGFQAIGLVAHTIEACLEPVRQGKISLDRSLTDIILKCLDFIERILKEPKKDLEKDPQIQNELNKLVPRLIAIATEKFGADFFIQKDTTNPEFSLSHSKSISLNNSESLKKSENLNPVKNSAAEMNEGLSSVTTDASTVNLEVLPHHEKLTSSNAAAVSPDSSNESSTVRVQVSLLDRLMNLVGEMVLVRNQVLQHAKNSEDNNYLNLTQRLDLVTSELQDQVMRTRMQPIGSVFTKFQRVVRDISRDLGKKIELKIVGAETELDKSLIEAIKDPMTHIVRNSCDHGIETLLDRKKSGKNETGTLSLKAFQEGGQVVIEIVDDGRGVDPKKIAAKAIEKGILTAERAAKMSDSEIQFLIFAPGFSTAEKVSSVSGRGVGMDVVRTNIEKVGGNIELISKAGFGTTLRLRIPLTLAIVPAMTIRSGEDFFAIPQVKLQELIRIDTAESGQKIEVLQGQPFYRLRGELLPLVNLNDVMENRKSKIDNTTFNVAVVKSDSTPYGLIVDEICDTADIVVKPLSTLLKKLNIFSGATILGDGNVALIIDVQGMAEYTHATRKNLDADKATKKSDIKVVEDSFTDEVGEY